MMLSYPLLSLSYTLLHLPWPFLPLPHSVLPFASVGYVIMLSGANDMLKRFNPNLSTGWVLLADILPTFFIKLLAPIFLQPLSYTSRVLAGIGFAMLAFLLVHPLAVLPGRCSSTLTSFTS